MTTEQQAKLQKAWNKRSELGDESFKMYERAEKLSLDNTDNILNQKLYIAIEEKIKAESEILWFQAVLEYAKTLDDPTNFQYEWNDESCTINGVLFKEQ